MPGRRSPDDDDAASVATSAEGDTVDAPRPDLAGVRVKFTLSSDGVFKVSGGIEGTKLQLGDTLVTVGGFPVQGRGMHELSSLLSGEPCSMVELELRRGWAQIPIRTELQRRGVRQKPPRAPVAAPGAGAGESKGRGPSFRDLPAPVFREMPTPLPPANTPIDTPNQSPDTRAAVAAVAAAARAAGPSAPPPADMGPLPAPGSRQPTPQSSVSSGGPSAKASPWHSKVAGSETHPASRQSPRVHTHHGSAVTGQGTAESLGRSPVCVTPVDSQISLNSQGGSKTSPTTDTLVKRLTRQVERLDADAKRREEEKAILKGKLEKAQGKVKQLTEELRDCADVDVLKALRARVLVLEDRVKAQDTDLCERSELIDRLERQLGVASAASAPGGALSFLNDLIGVKDKYSAEANKAREEVEEVKKRMQNQMLDIAQQGEEKERVMRELEQARMALSSQTQQDSDEAEVLREKVTGLEALQQAQLRAVMDQLVDAMRENERLVSENSRMRFHCTSLQDSKAELEEQRQQLLAQRASDAAILHELRATAEATHTVPAMLSKAEAEKRDHEAEKTVQSFRRRVEKCATLQSECTSLEARLKVVDSEFQAERLRHSEMAHAARMQVIGLQRDCKEANEQLERVNEEIEAERVRLLEQRESHALEIRGLKQTLKDRATESMEAIMHVERQLVAQDKDVTDMRDLLSKKSAALAASLEGVARAERDVSQLMKSLQSATLQIKEAEQEQARVRAVLEEEREQHAETKRAAAEAEERRCAEEAERRRVAVEAQEAREEQERQSQRMSQLEADHVEAQRQSSHMEMECATLRSECSALQARFNVVEAELEKQRKGHSETAAALERARRDVSEKVAALEALEGTLSEESARKRAMETELTAARSELERRGKALDGRDGQLALKDQEVAEARQEAAKVQSLYDEARQALEGHGRSIVEKEAALAARDEEVERLRRGVGEKEEALRVLETTLAERGRELKEAEVAAEGLKQERDAARDEVLSKESVLAAKGSELDKLQSRVGEAEQGEARVRAVLEEEREQHAETKRAAAEAEERRCAEEAERRRVAVEAQEAREEQERQSQRMSQLEADHVEAQRQSSHMEMECATLRSECSALQARFNVVEAELEKQRKGHSETAAALERARRDVSEKVAALEALEGTLSEESARKRAMETELTAARSELERRGKALDGRDGQLALKDQEVAEARQEAAKVQSLYDEARQALEGHGRSIVEKEAALAARDEEVERLRRGVGEKEEALRVLETTLAERGRELKEAEVAAEGLKQERDAARDEVLSKESVLAAKGSELDKLQSRVGEAEQGEARVRAVLEEEREQHAETKRAAAEAEERRCAEEAERRRVAVEAQEAREEQERQSQRMSQLEADHVEAQRQSSHMEMECATLRSECSALQARFNVVEAELEKQRKGHSETAAALERARRDVSEKVAALEALEGTLSEESARKRAMETELTAARSELERRGKALDGRDGQLALKDQEVAEARQEAAKVQSLYDEARQALEGHGRSIVEKEAALAARDEEVERLRRGVGEKEEALRVLETTLAERGRELKEAEVAAEGLKQERDAARDEVLSKESVLAAKGSELDKLQSRVGEAEQGEARVRAVLEEEREQHAETKRAAAEAEERRCAEEAERRRVAVEAQEAREEQERQSQRMSQLEADHVEAQRQSSHMEMECATLRSECSALQARFNVVEAELEKQRKGHSETAAALERARRDVSEKVAALEALEGTLSEESARKRAMETELTAARSELERRGKALDGRDGQLALKDQEVAEARQEAAKVQSLYDEARQALEGHGRSIVEKEAALAARDGEVERLRRGVGEKEEALRVLETTLAERGRELKEAEVAAEGLKQERDAARDEVLSKESVLAAKGSELDKLQSRVGEAEQGEARVRAVLEEEREQHAETKRAAAEAEERRCAEEAERRRVAVEAQEAREEQERQSQRMSQLEADHVEAQRQSSHMEMECATLRSECSALQARFNVVEAELEKQRKGHSETAAALERARRDVSEKAMVLSAVHVSVSGMRHDFSAQVSRLMSRVLEAERLAAACQGDVQVLAQEFFRLESALSDKTSQVDKYQNGFERRETAFQDLQRCLSEREDEVRALQARLSQEVISMASLKQQLAVQAVHHRMALDSTAEAECALRKSLASLANDLEKECGEINCFRAELNVVMEEHEQQIVALRSEHAAQMATEIRLVRDQVHAQHDEVHAQRHLEMHDILEKHASEMSAAAAHHRKQTAELEERLEAERASHAERVQVMTEQHAAELSTADKRHAEQIDAVTRQHDDELKAMTAQTCRGIRTILASLEGFEADLAGARTAAALRLQDEVAIGEFLDAGNAISDELEATLMDVQTHARRGKEEEAVCTQTRLVAHGEPDQTQRLMARNLQHELDEAAELLQAACATEDRLHAELQACRQAQAASLAREDAMRIDLKEALSKLAQHTDRKTDLPAPQDPAGVPGETEAELCLSALQEEDSELETLHKNLRASLHLPPPSELDCQDAALIAELKEMTGLREKVTAQQARILSLEDQLRVRSAAPSLLAPSPSSGGADCVSSECEHQEVLEEARAELLRVCSSLQGDNGLDWSQEGCSDDMFDMIDLVQQALRLKALQVEYLTESLINSPSSGEVGTLMAKNAALMAQLSAALRRIRDSEAHGTRHGSPRKRGAGAGEDSSMLDQGSAEAEMREQVGEMALLMAAKEQQIEALHVKILAQAELLQGVDEGRHATAQRLESWLLEILSSNGRHSWAGEALDDPSHDAGHAQFGNGIDARMPPEVRGAVAEVLKEREALLSRVRSRDDTIAGLESEVRSCESRIQTLKDASIEALEQRDATIEALRAALSDAPRPVGSHL